MQQDIYSAPESKLDSPKDGSCQVALWNPDVAGAWSLLFSPIFGSILVHKNWVSLGEEERASKAKIWIYVSILMAVISAFIGLFGLIYIVVWYFSSQKKQTLYLKENYSGDYPKKGWLKPIGIALVLLIGLIIILTAVFSSLIS